MPKTQKRTRKTNRRTQRTPAKSEPVSEPIPFTLNSKPTPGGRKIHVTSVPKHWVISPVLPVYIIFDLDGTLVDVDATHKPPLPAPQGLPKSLITTNDFIDSKGRQMNYPMYLRPGVKQLLAYLLRYPKRFQVGIWTASFKNYSVGVVRKLFGDDYRQKIFCLYGTDEIKDPQTGEPMRVVENIYTGRHLPSRTVNKKVVKDLRILFDEYPECNPGNTLLVDDLVMHKRENPPETQNNIYSIPIWDPHVNIKDDYIWKLLSAAKQNVIVQTYGRA